MELHSKPASLSFAEKESKQRKQLNITVSCFVSPLVLKEKRL